MNKDQLALLARHRKVKRVLADFAADVASVAALAHLATQYLQRLGLLDYTGTKGEVTSEGATIAKNTTGAVLIGRLVKAGNALYLLYKSENNLEEAAKMRRTPSAYAGMVELTLGTAARDLSQRVTARQADLLGYNVTPEFVAALAADAQAFERLLPGPQLAIDAGKLQGAAAAGTLTDLNRFLKDDLRAGFELISDTHPVAYKALREASHVDDAAFHLSKAKRATKAAKKAAAAAAKLMDTPAPDPAA